MIWYMYFSGRANKTWKCIGYAGEDAVIPESWAYAIR